MAIFVQLCRSFEECSFCNSNDCCIFTDSKYIDSKDERRFKSQWWREWIGSDYVIFEDWDIQL